MLLSAEGEIFVKSSPSIMPDDTRGKTRRSIGTVMDLSPLAYPPRLSELMVFLTHISVSSSPEIKKSLSVQVGSWARGGAVLYSTTVLRTEYNELSWTLVGESLYFPNGVIPSGKDQYLNGQVTCH